MDHSQSSNIPLKVGRFDRIIGEKMRPVLLQYKPELVFQHGPAGRLVGRSHFRERHGARRLSVTQLSRGSVFVQQFVYQAWRPAAKPDESFAAR
jgi:hypothetical protein